MTDRKELIEMIRHFYNPAMEEYKEAEIHVIRGSRHFLRKNDYLARADRFRHVKDILLKMDVMKIRIDHADEESRALRDVFRQCLAIVNRMCNLYIEMQEFLERKANSKDKTLTFSSYSEITRETKDTTVELNKRIHLLDALFVDYEERYGGQER